MKNLRLFAGKNIMRVFACAFFAVFALVSLPSAEGAAASKAQNEYIRAGLMQGQKSVSVSADGDFVVKDADGKKDYKYSKGKTAVISQQDRKVFVDKKGRETTTLIVAVKDGAPVIVNGRKYRGSLIIQPHKAGLTVINRLPVDEYLYGVVPEEMPADWPKEALKAQAVAARTYALYDKADKKHTAEGFDVCASTDCQVYGGIGSESAASNSAVNETKGKVLTYRHEPICAVFHAASGGSTENSDDVWGVNVPYLRAVNDDAEKSPYTQWRKEMTAAEFSRAVSQKFGDIGTIKQIDTSSFKQQPGSVKKAKKAIKITGSNKKTVEVTGAQLRSLLGLKSSNFVLTVTGADKKEKTGDVKKIDKPDRETVNIVGSGFGHRLGMSQWGAKSLADKGQNYQQILLHYYSDVNIEQLR